MSNDITDLFDEPVRRNTERLPRVPRTVTSIDDHPAPAAWWAWIPAQVLMLPTIALIGVLLVAVIPGLADFLTHIASGLHLPLSNNEALNKQSFGYLAWVLPFFGLCGYAPLYAIMYLVMGQRYPDAPASKRALWATTAIPMAWGRLFSTPAIAIAMLFSVLTYIGFGAVMLAAATHTALGLVPALLIMGVFLFLGYMVTLRTGANQYGPWSQSSAGAGAIPFVLVFFFIYMACTALLFIFLAPYSMSINLLGGIGDPNYSFNVLPSFSTDPKHLLITGLVGLLALGGPAVVEMLMRKRAIENGAYDGTYTSSYGGSTRLLMGANYLVTARTVVWVISAIIFAFMVSVWSTAGPVWPGTMEHQPGSMVMLVAATLGFIMTIFATVVPGTWKSKFLFIVGIPLLASMLLFPAVGGVLCLAYNEYVKRRLL